MRRTPSFVDMGDNVVFRGASLRRPDGLIGDFLENRRVLRGIQDKFHFEELEGVIDDDEALDAFYTFDGTRFIKERVLNLFDDSEYSFYSMFMFLVDKSFGGLYRPGVNNGVYGAGIYDFLSNADVDFKYIVELSEYIKRWSVSLDHVGLDKYGSDVHYVDISWSGSFSSFVNRIYNGCQNLLSPGSFMIPQVTRKMLWRVIFDWRFAARVRAFKYAVSNVSRALMVNYFRSLSACMNLPDDKYAEVNESELVDKWLELFDSFYPEYEKLKTWYILEKENSAGTAV